MNQLYADGGVVKENLHDGDNADLQERKARIRATRGQRQRRELSGIVHGQAGTLNGLIAAGAVVLVLLACLATSGVLILIERALP